MSATTDLGKVIVVGGGIIGCSTAYHLSELGIKCTVIERHAVACGASGKAGGFLAKTFCNGTAVGSLARTSFDLFSKYGKRFDCDYRAVDTLEVGADELNKRKTSTSSKTYEWLDQSSILNIGVMGSPQTTAQVHPEKVTKCFLEAALAKGSELVIAEVCGIEFSADGTSPVAVKLQDKPSIPCDVLILTLGPWTAVANRWFNYQLPLIKAQRAHSIVIEPKQPVPAQALFLSYKDKSGVMYYPEVYTRPDDTVYVCGYTDDKELPESPSDVEPNSVSCEGLYHVAGTISSALQGCKIKKQQACYLPVPVGDVPCIGKVPDYSNVYIAAGHYCWGILNAPATGKSLAELIVLGRSETVDLSPFDPAKFT